VTAARDAQEFSNQRVEMRFPRIDAAAFTI
jgi:hypothetical protein